MTQKTSAKGKWIVLCVVCIPFSYDNTRWWYIRAGKAMEQYYRVNGENSLRGKVFVQGSKNAVLPLLAATPLLRGVTVFQHVPDLLDVHAMLDILQCLGAVVSFDADEHRVVIDTSDLSTSDISKEMTGKMRCSVVFLGSLLGRFRCASIGMPGGCVIGSRPINLHMQGLRQMGVEIEEEDEKITAKVSEKLEGATIFLDFPSVGATQNLILAAVLAKGTTRLKGCACEPEVVSLCHFLTACGAKISGIGTGNISITGVEPQELHTVTWRVEGDRIAAATYLTAALACGGEVSVEGIDPWQLKSLTCVFMKMGARVTTGNHRLTLTAPKRCRAVDYIKTAPYPDFPTDMQSIVMTALSLADGTSVIEETIFENRFLIIKELEKCGARLKRIENRVMIFGVEHLHGSSLHATDLRSGAALLIAGLSAIGTSQIYGVKHILRGYEHPERVFQSLGGDIALVKQE